VAALQRLAEGAHRPAAAPAASFTGLDGATLQQITSVAGMETVEELQRPTGGGLIERLRGLRLLKP
jgi:hypothetical protein